MTPAIDIERLAKSRLDAAKDRIHAVMMLDASRDAAAALCAAKADLRRAEADVAVVNWVVAGWMGGA